jgi:CBS domain-containing protein
MNTPQRPAPDLERLGRADALRLLATTPIGRVAISTPGAPIVLPVNFALSSDDVIIRTGPGELVGAATHRRVVAFEGDGWDVASRTGWSVLVTGVAEEVSRPSELGELRHLGLQPWAPGLKGHIVRIRSDSITGRRIPQRSACDTEPPPTMLTGPDTPIGALALRTVTVLPQHASIVEAVAVLHESTCPIGRMGAGDDRLVTLAGLVRALASGRAPDARADAAVNHDLLVVTPHLSVVEALHTMAARNVGSALVRPAGSRGEGVLTTADVLPALLWYFDPAVAAVLSRG